MAEGCDPANEIWTVSYATQGIRVNAIWPGWIDTPMNQRLAEELGGMDNLTPIILRQQPNGRMLSTREVGNVVAFLSSDLVSGVTGEILTADGGTTAAIYQAPVLRLPSSPLVR